MGLKASPFLFLSCSSTYLAHESDMKKQLFFPWIQKTHSSLLLGVPIGYYMFMRVGSTPVGSIFLLSLVAYSQTLLGMVGKYVPTATARPGRWNLVNRVLFMSPWFRRRVLAEKEGWWSGHVEG